MKIVCALILGLLVGCAAPFAPTLSEPGAKAGLTLNISLGLSSRTILPTYPAFDHFEIRLSKAGSPDIVENAFAVGPYSMTASIPQGTWSLVVKAFNTPVNVVGQSTPQTLVFNPGQSVTANAVIKPLTTGDGSLTVNWDVSALIGMVDNATVSLVTWPSLAAPKDTAGNLLGIAPNLTGFPATPNLVNLTLPKIKAGTYLLTLQLTKLVGGTPINQPPVTEIVQIYGGLDSSKVYTLAVAEMTQPPAMPGTPSLVLASQTPNSNVILSWFDSSNTENGFKLYAGATFATATLLGQAPAGVATLNVPFQNSTYWITSFNNLGESTPNSIGVIPVSFVTVSNPGGLTNLEQGNLLGMTAVVTPANATNPYVTWVSDNPAAASVDAKGVVSALQPSGAVNISAQSSNPGIVGMQNLTLQPPNPPRWGLMGEWLLNEFTGMPSSGPAMAFDTSGHGVSLDAILIASTENRFGQLNSAVRLNGVDSRLSSSGWSLVPGMTGYTWSVWIKLSKVYPVGQRRGLAWLGANDGSPGSDGKVGGLDLAGSNLVSTHKGDDGTYMTPQVDGWTHVAMTYDPQANVSHLWLNGIDKGTRTHASPQTALNPGLFLGGDNVGTPGANLALDDVRVYDRPLAPTEIQNLYKEQNFNLVPNSAKVYPAQATLTVGKSLRLRAGFQVDNFTPPSGPFWGGDGSWSASGGAVSVDGSGLVTANASGTSTVTYTGLGGTATATIQVLAAPVPKLAYAVVNGGYLRAAEGTGGLYKSMDGGLTWTQVTSLLSAPGARPNGAWQALAVSDDGRQVWVGNADYNASQMGSLYQSQDAGATWAQINPTGSQANWTSVAVSGDGKHVIAVSYYSNYVRISHDGGQSWFDPAIAGLHYWTKASMSSDGRSIKLIAGGGADNIYSSNDGGQTFVSEGPGLSQYVGLSLAPNGGQAFVGTSDTHQLLMSPGGWVTTTIPPGTAGSYWPSLAGDWTHNVLFSGDFGNGPGGQLHYSYDAGTTWQVGWPDQLRYTAVSASRDGKLVLASADSLAELRPAYGPGGLILSQDGGASWHNVGQMAFTNAYNTWVQPTTFEASIPSSPAASNFDALSRDPASGAWFAVGQINGTSTANFGGPTASGAVAGKDNAVLVKYNADGTPAWARTPTVGSDVSQFAATAVVNTGHVLAAGSVSSTGTFNFGAGNFTGINPTGPAAVLVSYVVGLGNPNWQVIPTSIAGNSQFTGVDTDNGGNIYAVGRASAGGIGGYTFNPAITVKTGTTGKNNLLLMKFNNAGGAVWGRSTENGNPSPTGPSIDINATGVAVDRTNARVYVGGNLMGNTSVTLDNVPTFIQGTSPVSNLFLLAYDLNGVPAWNRTTTTGTAETGVWP